MEVSSFRSMGKASKLKRQRQRDTEVADVARENVDSDEEDSSGADVLEFLVNVSKSDAQLQNIKKKKEYRNLRGAIHVLYQKIFNDSGMRFQN